MLLCWAAGRVLGPRESSEIFECPLNCLMTRQNSRRLSFVLVLPFTVAPAGAAGAGSAQITGGPLLAFSPLSSAKARDVLLNIKCCGGEKPKPSRCDPWPRHSVLMFTNRLAEIDCWFVVVMEFGEQGSPEGSMIAEFLTP